MPSKDNQSPSEKCRDTNCNANSSILFNTLPIELRLKILSYFSIEELCSVLSLVCKDWYTLVHDPELRQHLQFKNLRFSSQRITRNFTAFAHQISHSTQLRSLSLSHCFGISHILKEVSKCCPFLTNLRIVGCRGFVEDDFQSLINNCTDVENIVIHYCDPEVFQGFSKFQCNILAGFANIRAINLKGLPLHTCLDLRLFADNCPNLVELGIADLDVDEEYLAYFFEKKKDVLKKISLNSLNLKDNTMSLLSKCQALTSLGLYAMIGNKDFILKYIERLGQLTHIGFEFGYHITVSSWVQFFSHKMGCKFVSIELDYCLHVNDEVLRCIGEHGNQLKRLRLKDTRIVTHTGIMALLSSCQSLEKLSLISCSGLTAPYYVTDSPYILPQLNELCVNGCSENCEEIIGRIRQEAPQLKVIVYEDHESIFGA